MMNIPRLLTTTGIFPHGRRGFLSITGPTTIRSRRQPCLLHLSKKKKNRCFGTQHDDDDNKPKVVLQKFGDFPYGSREYRLVLQKRPTENNNNNNNNDDENGNTSNEEEQKPLASIRAHRNIIFGAKLFGETAQKKTLPEVCLPLLDHALKDATIEGEQPQAIATLHGLCHYVTECLQQQEEEEENSNNSEALQEIMNDWDDDRLAYYAIQAIATGIPRKGHRIVGQGTYRDGEMAWDKLAREFINKTSMAEEVELYKLRGATLTTIEHLADTNPQYLKSAGGAMARMFFL